jgi:hypothetical protein
MFVSPLLLLSKSSFTFPEIEPNKLWLGALLIDGTTFTLGGEVGTTLVTGTPVAPGANDADGVGALDGIPETLRSTNALPVEEPPLDNTTKMLLSFGLSESETSKKPSRFVSLMIKIPGGTLLNTNEPALSVKVVAITTLLVESTREIRTPGIATSPILSLLTSSVTFPDITPAGINVGKDVAPGINVTLGTVDDDIGFTLVGTEVTPGISVTLGTVDDDIGFILVGTEVAPGANVTLGKVDDDIGFTLVGELLIAGETLAVGPIVTGTPVGLPLLLPTRRSSTKSFPVKFIPEPRTTKILLSFKPSTSDTSTNPGGFNSTTV